MITGRSSADIKSLVTDLNFAQKVDRSLGLLREAYEEFGNGLVMANSLGKDSVVVWHLAKQISPDIRGFIVTTRFKPKETVEFMYQTVRHCPEIRVFQNDEPIPDELYRTDPDLCCNMLKVCPTRQAIEEMEVHCWATGLRCTEGRTRTDFQEVEERFRALTGVRGKRKRWLDAVEKPSERRAVEDQVSLIEDMKTIAVCHAQFAQRVVHRADVFMRKEIVRAHV